MCVPIRGSRTLSSAHDTDTSTDLHTASFGRINSYYVRADLNDPDVNALATLLKPQIILHDAGHGGTLRGAATKLGIKAITVEIGNPQLLQVHPASPPAMSASPEKLTWSRVCVRPESIHPVDVGGHSQRARPLQHVLEDLGRGACGEAVNDEAVGNDDD